MKSVTWWAVVLLIATAAGCGAPDAATHSADAFGPPEARLELSADGRIETPADDGRAEAPVDDDDEFDLLEQEIVEALAEVADPLEGWNRAMFQLNDALYFAVVKPLLEGYRKVIPEPVRIALRNFFHNLGMPARVINCMLQGKWEAVQTELFRFTVNTTVGVLGFGDPAWSVHGVAPVNEDLGQTLGAWGVGTGCYLVWPLLGPSTVRDSVGMVGDQFLNPIRYVAPLPVSLGISAAATINEGSFHVGEYEALKKEALDPYVAVRQAYIQYRAKQVEE